MCVYVCVCVFVCVCVCVNIYICNTNYGDAHDDDIGDKMIKCNTYF